MRQDVKDALLQMLHLASYVVEHWDDPVDAPPPEPEQKLAPGAAAKAARRELLRKEKLR